MSFDCCSRYMECSDVGHCVNEYGNLREECSYRLKLEVLGLNFFMPKKAKKAAFIEIGGRQFKVNKLGSYGFSTYELNSDEREELRKSLRRNGIDVTWKKERSKCIKEPREEDEWACCKVRLSIKDMTYVIYSHDVRGITRKTAEKVRNYLVDRGLGAAIEVVQTNRNAVQGEKLKPKAQESKEKIETDQAQPELEAKAHYISEQDLQRKENTSKKSSKDGEVIPGQVSMFDLLGA